MKKKRRNIPQSRMHEVSIARSILEIVTEQCIKSGYRKIESINIRIGRASGISPDALLFAFQAVSADSMAEGADLNIEIVPVTGRCNLCNSDFTAKEEYVLKCPACGNNFFNINTGREMDIVDIEVT